jgi:hypothetical protein
MLTFEDKGSEINSTSCSVINGLSIWEVLSRVKFDEKYIFGGLIKQSISQKLEHNQTVKGLVVLYGLGYNKTWSDPLLTPYRPLIGQNWPILTKKVVHATATKRKEIERWSNQGFEGSYLNCGLGYVRTSSDPLKSP